MSTPRPDESSRDSGNDTAVTPRGVARGKGSRPANMGRYEILCHLATGGMAEIFLVRQGGAHGFEKYVVLKQIRERHAEDPQFVQMFLDEARLAARLQHQNIAQVYDIGEVNGSYFFTMEYLHGEDLRALYRSAETRAQRIPLEHALKIVAGAAAGLHYAHERTDDSGKPLKIVHRDVSPSNIVVTFDGGVKLVDFGIARTSKRRQETQSGSLKGKLAYMAPEQCLDDELDRRTDIFSLGIVLYELTTTRRLFRHGNESDYLVMNRIVHGDFPPPTAVVPDYPEELEKIVMRALAIDPKERFQTAQELLLAIEAFTREHELTSSAAALAGYVKTLFGERPEPWQQGFSGRDADATVRDIPVAPRGENDTADFSTAGLRILAKGKLRRANSSLSILRPMPQPQKARACRSQPAHPARLATATEVDIEPTSSGHTTLVQLTAPTVKPVPRSPRARITPRPARASGRARHESLRRPFLKQAALVAVSAAALALALNALGIFGRGASPETDGPRSDRATVVEPTVVAIDPNEKYEPPEDIPLAVPAPESVQTPARVAADPTPAPAPERAADPMPTPAPEPAATEPPAPATDQASAETSAQVREPKAKTPARSKKRRSRTRSKRAAKRHGKARSSKETASSERRSKQSEESSKRDKSSWDPNSPLPPSQLR